MTRPEFDELVGDATGAERERLRRVHELLVAAGPPAEVPPRLATPPVRAFRRRRLAPLALAAALAVAAFAAGYATADRDDSFEATRVVALEPTPRGRAVQATVRVGARDEAGNWPMQVTVQGLRHLPKGDYYEMFWLNDEGRKITCGTFNVRGPQRTTMTFYVAYSLDDVKGWELTLYRGRGHHEIALARA